VIALFIVTRVLSLTCALINMTIAESNTVAI
jgi:hypothetical protein